MSLDIRIFEIYGMSESSGPQLSTTSENQKLCTIGKELPGFWARIAQVWLPDGYSQILRSYVFGPSGFWAMAPLRCAA